MLVGHVAAALIAKRLQPRLSLGTATVATLIADVLVFSFVLAGIEHVQFRSGAVPGEYFTGDDIALSHSLATSAIWGVVIAAASGWRRTGHRLAAILIALAVSHWILDVVSHQPDMPLAPWLASRIGLAGLTGVGPLMVLEGLLWVSAVALYVSGSRSTNSAGRYVFWGGIASLTYVWYYNAYLPPRITSEEAPIEALILLLLAIGWAFWMNRAREMKEGGPERPPLRRG
jgi:hypothetical protein